MNSALLQARCIRFSRCAMDGRTTISIFIDAINKRQFLCRAFWNVERSPAASLEVRLERFSAEGERLKSFRMLQRLLDEARDLSRNTGFTGSPVKTRILFESYRGTFPRIAVKRSQGSLKIPCNIRFEKTRFLRTENGHARPCPATL